ncbi:MAG: polysaccharide deacetylase family protein [Chloroflexi bacterium]|nr:polysaccharide deacetylase family protein [Chloroflexota bacterium]
MRWFGLLLLIVIGTAVFAARTVKLPRSAAPGVSEPTRAALIATSQPAREPTAHATPAPAPARPTAPAAPAAAARPTSVSTPRTPSATHTPAVPTAATAPTHGPATAGALGDAGARGPSGEVALTFDAGADRGYAEDILDVLQEQHILASFGVTGNWAKANPDLVRRMAADGHLVFNHSLDHRSFTGVSDKLGGLTPARRRAELDDADQIIAPLLGHTTRPWYRLPYGDDDAQVAADLAPDGYSRKLGWTVDSLGWRGAQTADILVRCLKLAAPGGIYVFHVGRASQDALALPQIITGLRDKGFGFRRADQA